MIGKVGLAAALTASMACGPAASSSLGAEAMQRLVADHTRGSRRPFPGSKAYSRGSLNWYAWRASGSATPTS